MSLVLANFSAQVLKTIHYSIINGRMHLSMLVNTGGMPSSHSASVTAMTTSIGLIKGFDSVVFALAFCLSAVVMYDSAGVRRAAGKQAELLNVMVEELLSEEHKFSKSKLKELLGHTPVEVLAGAIFGILVSIGLRYIMGRIV